MSESQSTTHTPRFELLTRENYDTWRIQVEALLIKNDSSDYVSGDTPAPEIVTGNGAAASEALYKAWLTKDRKAKSDLILSISPSELKEIQNCASSRDVWEKLESTYASKTPARKAALYKQLTQHKMADSDSMIEHLKSFFDASDKLKSTGANLDDDLLAIMLLQSLPNSFEISDARLSHVISYPSSRFLKSRYSKSIDLATEKTKIIIIRPYFHIRDPTSIAPQAALPRNPRKKGHKEADCFKKKKQESKGDSSNLCFFTGTAVNTRWCLDSGSTSHVCSNKDRFQNTSRTTGRLQLASDATANICAKGDVSIKTSESCQIITLKDTLYVPDLRTNLVSVAKTVDAGFKVTFDKDCAVVLDHDGEIQAQADRIGDLYFFNDAEVSHGIAAFSKTKVSMNEWHARLGHLNSKDLKTMFAKKHAEGVDDVQIEDIDQCSTCAAAKMTREPFQPRTKYATKLLEVVHSDVCGPMRTTMKGGARWFVTFIDEHTRFCAVYFMREKAQVTDKFIEFKNFVENQTGLTIKELQSDGGKEYNNNRQNTLLKDAGIKRRFTVPHTPQQNGLAERKNRTLVETARCLLLQSGLPASFWAEAIHTANYIRNRCYSETVGCTPFEKWTGRKPSISHMRSFGEKNHVLNKSPTKGKFDRRGLEGIFLGYSDDSKAFRVWLTKAKKIIASRDVKFSGTSGNPSPSSEISTGGGNQISATKENTVDLLTELKVATPEVNETANEDHDDAAQDIDIHEVPDSSLNEEPDFYGFPSSNEDTNEFEKFDFTLPSSSQSDDVSPNDRITYRRRHDEDTTESAMSAREVDFGEALRGPDKAAWFRAIQEEIKCLIDNDTWTVVKKPSNARLVGCRTVLRNKLNPDGSLCRRKARLVAQGFSQIPGVDFLETFAPVARLDSLRILSAIAAKHDLKLYQSDVVTAYLHGELHTELFMQPPKMLAEILGSIATSEKDSTTVNKAKAMLADLKKGKPIACKLKKAIYGLRQSGRRWHEKINNALMKLGLRPTESDPCLYVDSRDKFTFVLLYVDDILFASNNESRVREIKKNLAREFNLKDMGLATYCLGIEIEQTGTSISLCQSGYIGKILSRFGMADCKPVSTPITTGIKLEPNKSHKSDSLPYRELIGALMYLSVGIRPDITHAVSWLSQFNSCFDKTHWAAAKRVLRYLKGTSNVKLVYSKDKDGLKGFADADWGSDISDRRSYTGYVFTLSNGAVSWYSKKQKSVALSSTESEYMSLSDASKEAIYLSRLLKELGFSHSAKTVLYNDNQSAGKLATNPIFHARSKHIDIRAHFVRDALKSGKFELKYLPTEEMTADILTKALPKAKTEFCVRSLGLI
ncbi:hypothetical protein TKK_0015865 [Trichogramma kaykai]